MMKQTLQNTQPANQEWEREKLIYLTRTLSRTERKNYENYIINAIYQRLNIPDLKPASQYYVQAQDDNKSHYLLDLYFPQLNIGIECDEFQHRAATTEDEAREIDIARVLKHCTILRIPIWHEEIATNSPAKAYLSTIDEVNRRIDEVVDYIRSEWDKLPETKKHWFKPPTPEEYFADKTQISVSDDIIFSTIADACNIVFQSGYNANIRRGWFRPKLKNTANATNFVAWFPRLAIKKDGNYRKIGKFSNILTNDGETIIESSRGRDMRVLRKNKAGKLPRVTFGATRDPFTLKRGWKFIGVFQHDHNEGRKSIHRRISDSFGPFGSDTILKP